MPYVDVVGAVIVDHGRILCTQRGPDRELPGLWEFPGGKIQKGESPSDALEREIHEELGCTIRVGQRVVTTEHQYPFATVRLTTFYCEMVSGNPVLSEHQAMRWLPPEDLGSLDWAPADIPAVEAVCATR